MEWQWQGETSVRRNTIHGPPSIEGRSRSHNRAAGVRGRWFKDLRHIMPFKLEIKHCESTSIQCSPIPKQNLFKGSQNSPAWPSGNKGITNAMIVGNDWKNTDRRKLTSSKEYLSQCPLSNKISSSLSQSYVTAGGQPASQPAPLAVEHHLELVARYFFIFLVRLPWQDGRPGHCGCYLNNLSVRTSQRALCVFTRTNKLLMPYRKKKSHFIVRFTEKKQ